MGLLFELVGQSPCRSCRLGIRMDAGGGEVFYAPPAASIWARGPVWAISPRSVLKAVAGEGVGDSYPCRH